MDDAALTLRLVEYLDRIPGWSWITTGTYPSGVVALHYGALAAAPDRGVGVRVYGDGAGEDAVRRRVQLRIRGARGDVTGADRMASTAHTVLEGLSRWGGILSAERISFAPLGADANGREERTDNYLITLDHTEASQHG